MLNTIQLAGRLTKDPELKTTPSGKSVVSFSIAVDRDFQSNGERMTDFINCVAWNGTAEFINRYFTKGKMIILCGRLQVRNYEAKDGSKRTATEVIAEKVFFAGDKGQTTTPAQEDFADVTDSYENDDLPF